MSIQQKIILLLSVLLAAIVTAVEVWVLATGKQPQPFVTIVITASTTFCTLLTLESLLNRLWIWIHPDSATSPHKKSSIEALFSSDRTTAPVVLIAVNIVSVTLALVLTLILWITVLDRILSGWQDLYRALILLGSFVLVYCSLFLLSNLLFRQRKHSRGSNRIFVSRKAELERLNGYAQNLNGIRWIQIYGIKGIGKTALLQQFKRQLLTKRALRHLQHREIRFFPFEERDWETILKDECNLKDEEYRTIQSQFVETTHDEAIILIDDFSILNDEFRKNFINALVAFATTNKNILLITASRERIQFGDLPSDIDTEVLSLEALSKDEVENFIQQFQRKYPQKYRLNKNIYDDINENRNRVKTLQAGHPYSIDRILSAPEIWQVVKNEPTRVFNSEALCEVMWTRLGPQSKEALRIIAVVAKYSRDWGEDVWAGLVDSDPLHMRHIHGELVDKNLVYQSSGRNRMHDITQDYVYNYASTATQRKELHRAVGVFFEGQTADPGASVLALKHFLSATDKEGTKRIHKNAIKRLTDTGSFSELVDLNMQALQLFGPGDMLITTLPQDEQEIVIELLLSQGQALRIIGTYTAALKVLGRCVEILQVQISQLGKALLVHVYAERADVYRLQGRYGEASQEYEASRKLAETLHDDEGMAKAAYGGARIQRLQGDLEEAASQYEVARAAFHKLGSPKQAWALFGLGEVCRLMGEFEKAKDMYLESQRQFNQYENKEGEAYATWGTGEINRLLSKYDAARIDYELSQKLCQEISDRRSEVWAIMGIAETLRMEHKYREALSKYEESLSEISGQEEKERSLEEQEVVETAHIHLGIAASKRMLGRTTRADYEISYNTYNERNMKQCIVHILIDSALCVMGNWGLAQSDLDQAEIICNEKQYLHEIKLIQKIRKQRSRNEIHPLNFP